MSVPQEERSDGAGGSDPRVAGGAPAGAWRGQRLGLPASGPGSLAEYGPRLGAFVTDIVLSALVAGLFTAPELPRNWSLVAFLAEYVAEDTTAAA